MASAKPQRSVPLRAIVLGGAVCGLLAVVALATRSDHPTGSGDATTRTLPTSFLDYVFTFSIVMGLVMLCAMAYYRARAQQVQGKSSWELKQMMMFLVAVALVSVIAVVWAERFRDGGGRRLGDVLIGTGTVAAKTTGARPAPARTPEFQWEALLVAATLGVAIAGGFALNRRARRKPEDRTLREDLAAILQDTLDKLWDEQDPRRAVILAYAWMERTLGAHGLPRRPAEAPLEYLSRVLIDLEASRESVLQLTTLFERARFSAHVIGEEMKADAIAALTAVRDELAAPEPAVA